MHTQYLQNDFNPRSSQGPFFLIVFLWAEKIDAARVNTSLGPFFRFIITMLTSHPSTFIYLFMFTFEAKQLNFINELVFLK